MVKLFRKKINKIKEPKEDKIYMSVIYTILFFAALSCLFPIMHVISMSFSSATAIYSGRVSIFPVGLTLDPYRLLILNTRIVPAFINSVIITVVGTVMRMVFTVMAAYPLSKDYMYGRRFFSLLFLGTMLFTAGLIPQYLLIKGLGLMNSYFAIWLPGLVGVYNLMVMRTFFEGISKDLEAAARIDGCSEWRIIWNVFLPLSKPVLAAMTLFYSVALWNTFKSVLIYIVDSEKHNLAVMVQHLIRSSTMTEEQMMMNAMSQVKIESVPEAIKAAGIVVMLVPLMLIYPWLQKYFVKGVMIGAIKS